MSTEIRASACADADEVDQPPSASPGGSSGELLAEPYADAGRGVGARGGSGGVDVACVVEDVAGLLRGELGAEGAGWLGGLLRRAAVEAGAVGGEVRLRVVGDDEMARAHAEHLGVEGTTDVITFDGTGGGSALVDVRGEPLGGVGGRGGDGGDGGDGGGGGVGAGVLDVDVLVCVDEARRRAGELGHGVVVELLLYGLHAVLHCLGWDDVTEEGFAAMHAEEDRVLRAIGVGAVFGGGGDDAVDGGGS